MAELTEAEKNAAAAEARKTAALANPQVLEQIQMLQALRDLKDSKLEEAWQLYQAGDFDGMQAAILASNFYRNNNVTARARKQAELAQPGVYSDGLEDYKLKTRKSLVSAGLKMDAKLFEGLAKTAYDSGMSDEQLKSLVVSSGLVTGYGGAVLGDTSSLKNYAN